MTSNTEAAAPSPPASPGRASKVWASSKTGGKKAFDWSWRKLQPAGEWMNAQAGKMGVEAFWPTDIPRECEKAARILWTFSKTRAETFEGKSGDVNSHKKTQKVIKRIPPEIIANAEGIACFTVWRMGLGLSGASGSGIVIARDSPTTWGPPSGILVHTISYGLLAGMDVYDVVLILRNKAAVQAFCRPKISLGAEIAAVAGPVGSGAALDTGVEMAPVLSYIKSKGLYGGIQLDGNIIIARDDENERFYGRRVSVKDLLLGGGQVAIPEGAAILHTVLEAAEGKPIDESLLPDDIDVAPSDRAAATSTTSEKLAESSSTTNAPPPVPPRRSVPPALASLNLDDPDEQIKKSPNLTSPAPPPRPPRRFTPNASPRVSGEATRSPRVSSEAPPAARAEANPFSDEKAVQQ